MPQPMEAPLGQGQDKLADPGPSEERDLLDWIPLEGEHRGFKIKWTGWKSSLWSLEIAGQWVGYAGNGWALAVNLPNLWRGRLNRGESIYQFATVEQIERAMTVDGRLDLIEEGRALLLAEIDKYLDQDAKKADA